MITNLKDTLVSTINKLALDVNDIEYVRYIHHDTKECVYCDFIDLLETLEEVNVEILDATLRTNMVIKDGLYIIANTWYLVQDDEGSGDWIKVDLPQMPKNYSYIEIEDVIDADDLLTTDYINMVKPKSSYNPYVRDIVVIDQRTYNIETINDIQCVVTGSNEVAIITSKGDLTPIWDLGFGRECDAQIVYHPYLVKLVMEQDLDENCNIDFITTAQSYGIIVGSGSNLYEMKLKDLEVLFIPKLF